MDSVLVTGGFGYVGSRLTSHLLAKGYRVRVLDLNLYGDDGLEALKKDSRFKEWETRFDFIRGDIRSPEMVEKALQGMNAVIHLAAISNDPTGEINEVLTRQVNFDAVGLLVSKAKAHGVKRFINASSSSVFGIKHEANVSEALEPEPITYYSKYKMLSEWVVTAGNGPGFATVNIRPATICGYSPRQRFDLTVNKLTADGIRKKIITVHGGQQRRPNVGMTDVIHLYETLLRAPVEKIAGRTFNFGFENLKVIEIAELIKKQLGANVEIQVTSTQDNRDYHISSQKILSELGYQPISSIAQEVAALQTALETNFRDIEAEKHYNMKSMHLEKYAAPYQFLSL